MSVKSSPLPWIKLRSASPGLSVYRRMVGETDPRAKAGDLVAVYDKSDAPYGVALYNPRSVITLRLLTRDVEGFDADAFFTARLERALELRRDVLKLDAVTDAYRLVYDQGDGLPGLVVDRYGSWLALEFYALGMHRQAERIERLLAKLLPGSKFVHRASPYTEKMEGFEVDPGEGAKTRVREHGVQFELDLTSGYKTGFFCDQRDNRRDVGALAAGKRVLDVCSYTGGFAIHAAKGGAAEVTALELDPDASAQAKRNANINQVRVKVTTADAFPYLRQAGANEEKYGLVIVDPHKLINSREAYREGRQKYIDINKLALPLVEPGGLLVTCSCSGMLPWDDFQALLRTAAGAARRRVQIVRRSGAGGDHPVMVDHPEGEYLKVIWCRVL
jgi:23S rRNA (cytosine1962-C5)-methyltransferase